MSQRERKDWKRLDVSGERYGRLVAICRIDGNSLSMWRCKCDCGREVVVQLSSLRTGNTRSCGCLFIEMATSRVKKHGLACVDGKKTRLFGIWMRMRQRCRDANSWDYKNYGGRGISVCDAWADFPAFHEWSMQNGYDDKKSIERIDNNGSYSPENCKWIPVSEQARNTRRTRNIIHNGSKKTLQQWSDSTGMSPSLITYRIKRWGVDKALSTPVKGRAL